jgi:N-carbamoyl-L-amino-acid hydrolase
MTGSHLDTQPTGGKFDGAYGVMAALEVVRTLNDHDWEIAAPIEIVAWTNEEGSRFSPADVITNKIGSRGRGLFVKKSVFNNKPGRAVGTGPATVSSPVRSVWRSVNPQ